MFLRATALAAISLAAAGPSALASALPSYSCVFTEPFAGVDSFPGGLRYSTPEKSEWLADAELKEDGPAVIIAAKRASGEALRLKIVEGVAGDGMSDFTRPWTGTLTGPAAGQTVMGACLKFPDGTTPRPVKNIKDSDKLNVRQRPTTASKVINTVGPGGFVWAFPEDTVNGWARAATAAYPAGESGPITIVEGWVKARFLGMPGDR